MLDVLTCFLIKLLLTLPSFVLGFYPLLMRLDTFLFCKVKALSCSVVRLPPILINFVSSQDDLRLKGVDDILLGFVAHMRLGAVQLQSVLFRHFVLDVVCFNLFADIRIAGPEGVLPSEVNAIWLRLQNFHFNFVIGGFLRILVLHLCEFILSY